jgi:hypothetical protein
MRQPAAGRHHRQDRHGRTAWRVNEFPGTKGTPDGAKLTRALKILKSIMEQYNEHGRLAPIGDEELEEPVPIRLPDLYAQYRLRV